jgi:hypothetical protein
MFYKLFQSFFPSVLGASGPLPDRRTISAVELLSFAAELPHSQPRKGLEGAQSAPRRGAPGPERAAIGGHAEPRKARSPAKPGMRPNKYKLYIRPKF